VSTSYPSLFGEFDTDTIKRAMHEARKFGFPGNHKALKEAERQNFIKFRPAFGVWELTERGQNFLNSEDETP